mmetsp:Transcript_25271/g.58896  ORF Transcript_25271/g.58896 Transcript_25271/m.58896 type:complete len:222 (+) Transcript_25271:701-1366(+)
MIVSASTAQKRTSQSGSLRKSATSTIWASTFMAPSATSAAHLGLRMAMGSREEPPPTCSGIQARSSSGSCKSAATSGACAAAFSPQLPKHRAAAARIAGFASFSSSLSLEAEVLRVSSGSLERMDSDSERVCMSGSQRHFETMSLTQDLHASSPMAAKALMAENRVFSLPSFVAMSPAKLAPTEPKLLNARHAAPWTSGEASVMSPETTVVCSVAPIMPRA